MKIARMHFVKFIISGLLSILLISCSSRTIPINGSMSVDSKLLSFPAAYYQSIVFVKDQLIAFTFSDAIKPTQRVAYAYENDPVFHPFNPQGIESCKDFIGYLIKGKLPDGRIGFLGCGQNTGSTLGIFAYDWETGETEQLIKGPLAQGYLPKDFTWNPETTIGIQEMVSGGGQGTIHWISPQGIAPMDVEIENNGLKWNLKDYFEGKEKTGLVRFPAWSPDGKTIAFFASPYDIREEPDLKPNINYDLYFMDPVGLNPDRILQGIVDAFRLRWSLDSKELLFDGCAGSQGKCGLWLYDAGNRRLSLIAEGEFKDFIWISDNRVIAIRDIALPYNDNEIWEYSIEQR